MEKRDLSSAAAVWFWTLAWTRTFPNLTNVRFEVQVSARTEREVQSKVLPGEDFAESIWTGSNASEPMQNFLPNSQISLIVALELPQIAPSCTTCSRNLNSLQLIQPLNAHRDQAM